MMGVFSPVDVLLVLNKNETKKQKKNSLGGKCESYSISVARVQFPVFPLYISLDGGDSLRQNLAYSQQAAWGPLPARCNFADIQFAKQ